MTQIDYPDNRPNVLNGADPRSPGPMDFRAKGGAAMHYLIASRMVLTMAAFFLAVASSLDAMPSPAADMAL